MNPRLDLPLAVLAWTAGFAWVGARGTWWPIGVLAVVLAARLLAGDPGTRRRLALRPSHLALGAAGAAAMIGATYGLYGLLAPRFALLGPATAGLYAVLHAGRYPSRTLAALVVVIAACEEIVWRGRVLRAAEAPAARPPLSRAAVGRVLLASALYGACHLGSGSLLLAALAFGCGACWGLLRVAGRSLWPSIVTHVAWDLAVLIAWPLA